MLQLFILFLFFFRLDAQTYIYPGIYGDELSDLIINEYSTSTTLGYSSARDTMYSIIDSNNGSVSCIYTDFSVNLIPGTDPSITMYEGGINCEHSWPQSMGASTEPMKSDLHHLFPCKENVNSSRGNNPYSDIVDDYTDSWFYLDQMLNSIPEQNIINNYSESYTSSNDDRFEPKENSKGNISRAMFYFNTIYQSVADQNFFDLQKDILFEWHYNDVANQVETNRTWMIASYQDDIPNPFVIDPTLAWRIYFINSHPIGDTNSDQEIDILDIVLIANEILNMNNLSGLQKHQSDLNADFTINVLDILFVVNMIIG